MPRVRKVAPEEAATWDLPEDLLRLGVTAPLPHPPPDRRGLIRVVHPRSRTVGWQARVYAGGREIGKYFADRKYGGTEQALRWAAAWRDARAQQLAALRAPLQRSGPRIVRVDRPEWKNVGYFAYRNRKTRRYFSDSVYGGPAGARKAAEDWIREAEPE